jgi:lysophospholipase L1-like esterase
MAKRRKGHPRPKSLGPGRRRLFAAITFALPFLGLALAEVVLRLFGWGGYPDWIRPAGILPSGETLCIVEPAAAKPYFYANPDRPGYAEQSNFLMPKPKNTFRIFVVGESAAKGYPQPRNLAVSSFLEAMLSDATNDKKVEVINLGTTAVASFPLVYQVRDALRFDPDLFVFYVGNNEFFGAYGVASINASGSLPVWALRAMRAARGLALVQILDAWLYKGADENRSLMEQMIGRTFIAVDSPLRETAARNLGANLGAMLDEVKRADIPVLVCTTASNESGLAPLGQDDMSGLDENRQNEVRSLVAQAESAISANNPELAGDLLDRADDLAPSHARARFLLGQAMAAMGRTKEAREAFLAARDRDTMPWRPTSRTEEAIRSAARARGAPLCDIASIFRDESAQGATGWDLLDDHVHLSLAGQARAARAMAAAVGPLMGLDPTFTANLPDDQAYTRRLGRNFYDDYRVNHTLRVLFGIPFMRETNPLAFARFEQSVREAEAQMSPPILSVAREWQTFRPHAGGLRPLTGMVARVKLRENLPAEALPLYGGQHSGSGLFL